MGLEVGESEADLSHFFPFFLSVLFSLLNLLFSFPIASLFRRRGNQRKRVGNVEKENRERVDGKMEACRRELRKGAI